MTQYRSESKGRKDKDNGLELSIGQVLAAAGATVIGALLAKVLNIWGTVAGTAVLSVCSSIGAVLILRAMRRTGDRIKSQIAAMAPVAQGKAPNTVPGAAAPGAVPGDDATVAMHPESVSATAKIPTADELEALGDDTADLAAPPEEVPPGEPAARSRKRTLVAILVSSVLVFGLTIGTLYLIGAFTGDPDRFIQGDTQTTIVVTPNETTDPAETASEQPSGDATPSEDATEAPTGDAPTTEEPTASETPGESTSEDAGQTGGGQGGTGETASPEPEEQEPSPSESTTAG
ncbi:hypothetical protein [Glycomyces harbinensis]|uniref:Uncharacterized protein n=1 Tax=Glycomyces harbinensis TaxID=58114 RepID=A0A1G6T201_9ACTN|nr:hypothetical protein [Glycomyces harbinensis]SDD22874.1 hypothetical protein SAMN05216270_102428 [Glycomyces harbinensis]